MNMDAIERALNIRKAMTNVDARKSDVCEIELWLSFSFDCFAQQGSR